MRLHPLQGTTEKGRPCWQGFRLTAPGLLLLVALLAAPPAHAEPSRQSVAADIYKRMKNAVVNIHSERTVAGAGTEDIFAHAPSQNRINGMGTGIVIDPRGYVVTNHHVVEDVNLIRVILADGTTTGARVIARDAAEDLAVLKIDVGRPLQTVTLGTSQDLMVGEPVVAIGNAYGYNHTLSEGTISAVKRDVTLNKEVSYKGLIQTNAPINPGNSGGPLFNVYGEVIGVNVAIRAGAQNIGFAIPVDTVIRVASDMISVRKRSGTTHGLVVRDQVADDPQLGPGASRRSVVVERVDANGPAARTGVQRGDVVVQAADQPVTCSLDLERALLDRPAGETVSLTVRRSGTDQKVDLALQGVERGTPAAPEVVWRKLGLKLQSVNAETVARTNQQLHGGLSVVDVRADGAAGKAGFQKGDILVGLHQWEMLSAENVVFVLTHPDLASFNPLKFYIVRNGQVHRGWIQQVD
jgi:serine protease Do